MKKEIRDLIRISHEVAPEEQEENFLTQFKSLSKLQREEELERMDLQMRQYAKDMNFEAAAQLRDIILELKATYMK